MTCEIFRNIFFNFLAYNNVGEYLMKKWEAIIFDMDGTLFDSERIARNAWFEYGKLYNAPVTDAFILELTGVNMNAVPAIWKKHMPERLSQDEGFECMRRIAKEYKMEHGPLPKADLVPLMDHLKEKGYKIALCTSSREEVIDLNFGFVEGLKERFDVLVNGTMTEKGKPAPDIYLLTASKLNIEPSKCLVIEDSKNGVFSAHNAGMDVIIAKDITEPTQEMKDIAYTMVDHLDELKEIA